MSERATEAAGQTYREIDDRPMPGESINGANLELSHAIDRLTERYNELLERIAPVLKPSSPSDVTSLSLKRSGEISDIQSFTLRMIDGIGVLSARVDDTIYRLDI